MKPRLTMKKKTMPARFQVPWYMVVFILLFVAVLFFDFEHRQKQRFENINEQMEKLAVILASSQAGGVTGVRKGRPALPVRDAANSAVERASPVVQRAPLQQQARGRELSAVADYIYPESLTRGNNTHFFYPYGQQKSPEDVYRFIGTVDVADLAEKVKNTPESIWAEGDERSKKYKVHQYTSTIAFRLSGDHLRELGSKLDRFEGKRPTQDILNFDGSMEFSHHWPEYGPLIQPILDKIQATFDNNDRTWLRVLLVRLEHGKAVSMHRDNGCWMRISRRIHVPIITHDKVTFHVKNTPKGVRSGGKEELLPVNTPGNIVELNNAMTHFVNNDAPVDRVHLIVDYMPDVPNELTYSEAVCIFGGVLDECEKASSRH